MAKDMSGGLQSIPCAHRATCRISSLSCAMGTTSWLWDPEPGTGMEPELMESLVWRVKSSSCPWGAHWAALQCHTFLQDLLPAFQEPWKTRILEEGSEGWRDPTAGALGLFVGSPYDPTGMSPAQAELRNSVSIPWETFSDLRQTPRPFLDLLCHLAPGQHSPDVPTIAEIGNINNFSHLFELDFLLQAVVSQAANLTDSKESTLSTSNSTSLLNCPQKHRDHQGFWLSFCKFFYLRLFLAPARI